MQEFRINEKQIQTIGNVLMKLSVETALVSIDILRSLTPIVENTPPTVENNNK